MVELARSAPVAVRADGDDVVADCVDHVVPLEDARDLLGRAAVRDVVVLEDLGERPAAMVLADHVLRDAILGAGTDPQERERSADCLPDPHEPGF